MKKSTWAIIVIVIVIIGIVCGMNMNKYEKQDINTTKNSIEQNKIVNTDISNVVNTTEENEIVNETSNTIYENTINEVNSETFEGEAKSEEEKAILIVKKDYGTNENIKFSIEGMDENGRQVVVIRNTQTTEALAFYFVNVSEGTFTKKEMN